MSLADLSGAATILTALVVTALTAKFIAVARVFFAQALYGLIVLNRGG
jgi:hypothetical protein